MTRKIAAFQDSVKSEIKHTIESLVKANGGSVRMRLDSHGCYPSVYGEDAHCTVLSLVEIGFSRNGQVMLRCHSNLKRPHLDYLPICELLQIWELVIENTTHQS